MEQVIKQIIEGKLEGESAADILTLCYLASLVVSAVEVAEEGGVDPGAVPPAEARDIEFEDRLARIGKILCPLADDVKHDRYRQGMTEVRLGYAGVAISGTLQQSWTEVVASLARDRLLASVEIAVEHEIYQMLDINNRMFNA